MYCDAHFHLMQCAEYYNDIKNGILTKNLIGGEKYRACSCAHFKDEYAAQHTVLAEINAVSNDTKILNAYGIHPQNPVKDAIPFLETLLEKKELDAIGETGFDLFTPEFKSTIDLQETVWNAQIELAAVYGKPVIVHCRKATARLFRDSKKLKKIPAVIFHSFSGSRTEALSLLRRGINGYFSFGKPILNGNKRAIDCTANLPVSRLLLETDAPFQTLKGEKFTELQDIVKIYRKAFLLRKETEPGNAADEFSEGEFKSLIESNFIAAFGVR